MSLHFHYAQKMRMAGGRASPYNFGGDSSSDSSQKTTNNTTNNVTSTDKRAVASDQAVAITGDNNTVDRSTSNLTQFFDSSNRSTTSTTDFTDNSNRSTNFADSSNRSTTTSTSTSFADNSNRSTNTYTTNTDYGSVSGALGMGSSLGTKALDVAGTTLQGTLDVMKQQAKNSADATSQAFNFATAAGANSLGTSAQVLGFASGAIQQTADAFAQAKDGGQSKMVMATIAAAAVVGVAFALR